MANEGRLLRTHLLCFLLWPVLLLLFVPLLPIIPIIFILKATEYAVYRTLHDARILPHEDILWTISSEGNQFLINAALTVDGRMEVKELLQLVDYSMVNARDENGRLVYWKCKRRIVAGFLNYYWLPDQQFDIKDHVNELDNNPENEDELREVMSQHRSTKLNLHSPWEFTLIPHTLNGVVKTLIFVRLSHAIADGSALAYFLVTRLGHRCTDVTEDVEVPVPTFSHIRKEFSHRDRLLMHLKALWILPVAQTESLFAQSDSNPLQGKPTGKKTITWTPPIDLQLIKRMKNNLRCTVNDLLMALITKTLTDYFRQFHSERSTFRMSLLLPVDVRSSPAEAERFNNKLAAIFFRVPLNDANIVSLVQNIKSQMDHVKSSGEAFSSIIGWRFISYILPPCFSIKCAKWMVGKATGSVSNLIGPQKTIAIGKHSVDSVVFWSPQINEHCFGASFCSYKGCVVMGLEGDQAVLERPSVLVKLFEENINHLKRLVDSL